MRNTVSDARVLCVSDASSLPCQSYVRVFFFVHSCFELPRIQTTNSPSSTVLVVSQTQQYQSQLDSYDTQAVVQKLSDAVRPPPPHSSSKHQTHAETTHFKLGTPPSPNGVHTINIVPRWSQVQQSDNRHHTLASGAYIRHYTLRPPTRCVPCNLLVNPHPQRKPPTATGEGQAGGRGDAADALQPIQGKTSQKCSIR
jgi:hypothetical protein